MSKQQQLEKNNQTLTQEQQERLQAILNMIRPAGVANREGTKFISLKDGESKTLYFDPDKLEIVDNEYEGRITKKVRFTVIDENDNEKWFELSRKWAGKIIDNIKKGFVVQYIERSGKTAQDTIYYIKGQGEPVGVEAARINDEQVIEGNA